MIDRKTISASPDLTSLYLTFWQGIAMHFVSADLEISSAMFKEIVIIGIATYSKYFRGFLGVTPLILIASLIFLLSSLKEGKNRNITAMGILTTLGILILSIEVNMLPTSLVRMRNFPAIKGKKKNFTITIKVKNIFNT